MVIGDLPESSNCSPQVFFSAPPPANMQVEGTLQKTTKEKPSSGRAPALRDAQGLV